MQLIRSVGLICLLSFLLVGCTGPSTPPSPTPPSQPTVESNEVLKQRLNGMAESGTAGSALGGMREAIQKLGKEDLLKDLDELEKAQDPAAVKAIAKRMLEKL
jgi:hypothetical protein